VPPRVVLVLAIAVAVGLCLALENALAPAVKEQA
jgi:hypothetical protein